MMTLIEIVREQWWWWVFNRVCKCDANVPAQCDEKLFFFLSHLLFKLEEKTANFREHISLVSFVKCYQITGYSKSWKCVSVIFLENGSTERAGRHFNVIVFQFLYCHEGIPKFLKSSSNRLDENIFHPLHNTTFFFLSIHHTFISQKQMLCSVTRMLCWYRKGTNCG